MTTHLADLHATKPRVLHSRPGAGAVHARADRSGHHPQFLHYRPHRPRQVHPCRPDATAHRRGRGPSDAGAVPGPDGHRARARHHDQEPGRPAAVARPRRPRLRAEPDRHPRPRRLLLRGVPVAGRLRGRDPAGRRRAGDRGADPGQPLPGPRRRPAPDPGAEQDRPARRAAGEVRRGAGRHHRLRAVGRAAGVGQDRRRRGRPAERGRRAGPAAQRRPGCPGPRADLRLGLRHLPRRRDLRPGHGRAAVEPGAHPDALDQGRSTRRSRWA